MEFILNMDKRAAHLARSRQAEWKVPNKHPHCWDERFSAFLSIVLNIVLLEKTEQKTANYFNSCNANIIDSEFQNKKLILKFVLESHLSSL